MPTLRGLLHSACTPADIAAAMPILITDGAVDLDGSGNTGVYRARGPMREPGEN